MEGNPQINSIAAFYEPYGLSATFPCRNCVDKGLAVQDGLRCVNNGFCVAVVNVGGTSHQSEIDTALVGWLDLGSSATQTFISFPNGAFLSLLFQSVSVLAGVVLLLM